MKKIILTLVIIACFCFFACDGSGSGNSTETAFLDKTLTEVQPITVDGTEVSVKDFLIDNLNKYISTATDTKSSSRLSETERVMNPNRSKSQM